MNYAAERGVNLLALGESIASRLSPGTWAAFGDPNNREIGLVYLAHDEEPTAAKLDLTVDHKGRLHVSGKMYVDHKPLYEFLTREERDEGFSISVDVKRPAEAIAKDIMRRLLPRYLASFTAALAKRDDTATRTERAKRLLVELVGPGAIDRQDPLSAYPRESAVYKLTITPSYSYEGKEMPESVYVHRLNSISVAKAKALLALAKDAPTTPAELDTGAAARRAAAREGVA
jgi:hypothetical protein